MFERQHNGRIRRKLKTKEERLELIVHKGRKNNKILGIIKTLDFFFLIIIEDNMYILKCYYY